MKTIKVLGFAMAILVVAAFAGAGSASASGTFCYVSTTPCPSVSVVPTGVAVSADSACYTVGCNAGTETERVVFDTGRSGVISCVSSLAEDAAGAEASVMQGSVVQNGSGQATISWTSLAFNGCSNASGSCTVSANLSQTVPFVAIWNYGPSGSYTGHITAGGSSAPYIQLTCGSVSCQVTAIGGSAVVNGDVTGRLDARGSIDDGSQTQFSFARSSTNGNCTDAIAISTNYALYQADLNHSNIYLTQ